MRERAFGQNSPLPSAGRAWRGTPSSHPGLTTEPVSCSSASPPGCDAMVWKIACHWKQGQAIGTLMASPMVIRTVRINRAEWLKVAEGDGEGLCRRPR